MTRYRDVAHAIATLPDAREDGRPGTMLALLAELDIDSRLLYATHRPHPKELHRLAVEARRAIPILRARDPNREAPQRWLDRVQRCWRGATAHRTFRPATPEELFENRRAAVAAEFARRGVEAPDAIIDMLATQFAELHATADAVLHDTEFRWTVEV